ncbi:MAG TPA: hypothetical protein VGD49_09560 [Longimicrobiales bacterium]
MKSPDEILAAKAVLLTLCAALGRETQTRYIVGPNKQPLDIESAAEYVSGLPKPVICSAMPSNGDAIKVSCLPGKRDASMLDLTTGAPTLSAKAKTTGGADILLIGAGDSLRLTAEALDRWVNDYAINMPMGISGDDPKPEQQKAGIHWVLRVFPGAIISTSVQDFQLSPEMTDLIGKEFDRVRRRNE